MYGSVIRFDHGVSVTLLENGRTSNLIVMPWPPNSMLNKSNRCWTRTGSLTPVNWADW
jgi:hypothetical protein